MELKTKLLGAEAGEREVMTERGNVKGVEPIYIVSFAPVIMRLDEYRQMLQQLKDHDVIIHVE